jgi:hypothetical protein
MKRMNRKVFLAIACLALAAMSCQALSNLGGSGAILQDDFSTAQWGTGTDVDSSIEYANNALQMQVFTQNYFVWSTPNDEVYDNIHMEVTAINNNTDPTTAIGIMCHQQVTDSGYYFAITPAGQYAIAKNTVTEKDIFLTNDNTWEYSDVITANAASYRLGVDCGANGTLTLYVDGQQVDSVIDTDYTNGGVALFTWSGEEVASADVSFDDFIMTTIAQP